MIKVLIVDDHPVVREGIKKMFEKNSDVVVAGEAENEEQLWNQLKKNNYDIILLDISMPNTGGIKVLENLKRKKSNVSVLILSMHDEEQYVIRALKAGASGYVTKQSMADELLTAIRKVSRGGKYVSAGLSEEIISFLRDTTGKLPHEKLSPREREILCFFSLGKTTKEIARELSLSANTVSTYRYRIMEKMQMKNIAEIIRYALKNKLID